MTSETQEIVEAIGELFDKRFDDFKEEMLREQGNHREEVLRSLRRHSEQLETHGLRIRAQDIFLERIKYLLAGIVAVLAFHTLGDVAPAVIELIKGLLL